MSTLIELDQELFFIINQNWQNAFFDAVLAYWRNKYFWIPLYLFMLSFILINLKWKGWYMILGIALTIGIADTTSSKLIKPTIKRLRPCRDLEIKDQVHVIVHCGSGYSFTSSHATNHFALATFLILTLGAVFKWIRIPLLLWAATISIAQVYVGVHYPLDIIGGALLGTLIGILIGLAYIEVVGRMVVPSD